MTETNIEPTQIKEGYYLTISQMVKSFGLTQPTIRQWINSKKLEGNCVPNIGCLLETEDIKKFLYEYNPYKFTIQKINSITGTHIMGDKYLSISQVAELENISSNYVWRKVKNGNLASLRIARGYIVSYKNYKAFSMRREERNPTRATKGFSTKRKQNNPKSKKVNPKKNLYQSLGARATKSLETLYKEVK